MLKNKPRLELVCDEGTVLYHCNATTCRHYSSGQRVGKTLVVEGCNNHNPFVNDACPIDAYCETYKEQTEGRYNGDLLHLRILHKDPAGLNRN